jgi:hypothetical protein
VHKLTHPNGSVLLIQRPKEVQAFVNAQPRVLPQGPAEVPQLSAGLMRFVLRALAIMLVLAVAFVVFFLFGEDREREPLRPVLTAQQRAQAFRTPHGN